MNDPVHTADTVDPTWVLNELTRERGVLHALLYTADGLLMAASEGLADDVAERSAAAFCGILANSRNLGEFCAVPDGQLPWQFDIKAHGDHTVLVFAASASTGLAVSVAARYDSPEVAVAIREIARVINGLGPLLAARERGWERR